MVKKRWNKLATSSFVLAIVSFCLINVAILIMFSPNIDLPFIIFQISGVCLCVLATILNIIAINICKKRKEKGLVLAIIGLILCIILLIPFLLILFIAFMLRGGI